MQRTHRIHRLPQRLDYTLIPAPLDLSLPLISEKSPLPAIIVTPSSPSSSRDFSIAFLAPPVKPSLRERIVSYTTFSYKSLNSGRAGGRARTTLFLMLLIFILLCHLVTHRLAARRPYLEFSVQPGQSTVASAAGAGGWFDFSGFWGAGHEDVVTRDFVVPEMD